MALGFEAFLSKVVQVRRRCEPADYLHSNRTCLPVSGNVLLLVCHCLAVVVSKNAETERGLDVLVQCCSLSPLTGS